MTNSDPAIEALRQFYAAINRNDMDAVARELDPQVVRVGPEGFPSSGTYRGTASVLEIFRKGRGTWAEGSCDPQDFLVQGDKVVVSVHVRVRLNGKTDWIDARIADGFVFRQGKIVEFLTFVERAEALRWAGID